jgi:CBS domain-containing protein
MLIKKNINSVCFLDGEVELIGVVTEKDEMFHKINELKD